MSLFSEAAKLLRTEGIRGLVNGFRRFLYFRIPNRRVPLQVYYLYQGKLLRKVDNGWGLQGLWDNEEFYFPQLQSHALHTDRHVEFLKDTYFMGEGVEIEPGDVVFDVGGYIGITSRVAAEQASQVYAIEPSPRAQPSLAKNTKDYDNIKIVNCAVSDENSEMDLQLGKDITDDSLIDPDDEGSGETITVPVKTLSQLTTELEVPTVDFLKVEAEGLEPEVVRGATNEPVRKIAVAGNDERYGETTYQEVTEILRNAGFSVNKNPEDLPYNMVFGTRDDVEIQE